MKRRYKIALIVIVVIGVLISIKSCVDRKNPDVTAAYIGDGFVNYEAFEACCFDSVFSDVNSDGKHQISLMEISFNEELSQADRQNSMQKMSNALGMGSARVYFIDEKYAIANSSAGVFCDLSHLGDGLKNSDGEVVAISIRGNEKVAKMGIDTESDLYLAVRVISEVDAAVDKNIGIKHQAAMELAEYILS